MSNAERKRIDKIITITTWFSNSKATRILQLKEDFRLPETKCLGNLHIKLTDIIFFTGKISKFVNNSQIAKDIERTEIQAKKSFSIFSALFAVN